MSNEANKNTITPPTICPNCADINTVTVITKTFGTVVRYYFKCSSCGYTWPATSA